MALPYRVTIALLLYRGRILLALPNGLDSTIRFCLRSISNQNILLVFEQGNRGLNNGLEGLFKLLIRVLADAPIDRNFFTGTLHLFLNCLVLHNWVTLIFRAAFLWIIFLFYFLNDCWLIFCIWWRFYFLCQHSSVSTCTLSCQYRPPCFHFIIRVLRIQHHLLIDLIQTFNRRFRLYSGAFGLRSLPLAQTLLRTNLLKALHGFVLRIVSLKSGHKGIVRLLGLAASWLNRLADIARLSIYRSIASWRISILRRLSIRIWCLGAFLLFRSSSFLLF